MDASTSALFMERTEMDESLEIFYARRKQVDDFSQQPRHSCFFYRGKWHYCACPECRENLSRRHADDSEMHVLS